jgi:iron complex outermembrane receptor protein
VLRDATNGVSTWPLAGGIEFQESAWRNTGGLMAHGDVTLGGRMVVSGGLRLERHSGYTALSEIAVLPTLGASYTRRLGPASLRIRSAYGKAIRPPRLSRVSSDWSMQLPAVLRLDPEEQSGIESGADLTVGSAFRLRVTHFSQQATGLIQPVGVRMWGGSTSAPQWMMNYELQNVGAIDNRGWEFQGGITQGRLHLGAGYSVLESRVNRVADAYTGDLRAGDRVLQVPARTMSLTGSWVARSWTSSWTVARAADWVNYDWLAIAAQPGGATNPGNTAGGLRSFWRSYDGVTRLRAHFTRDLTEQIGFEFTGENLLGQQLGEPDNVTIVPGRTISAGLRARF